ncbi:MAG: penicillin-binding protein activator LpoB [Phycisphaeraceae bacterium]|nr:penicillin-binding protein activator LpoB [Phycisphaeraceae bacterium]
MNTPRLIVASGLALTATLFSACSGNWKVDRKDPTQVIDLDYRFNDVDARATAETMIKDILSRPWISNWARDNGGKAPIVYVGTIRNDTQDYNVNPELFTSAIVRELINSGRVRVKAERDARQELRDERLDTKYNDPATIKAIAKELNADFALTGNVQQVMQRTNDGRTLVNYYQINAELTNVETLELVWKEAHEIKKVAKR